MKRLSNLILESLLGIASQISQIVNITGYYSSIISIIEYYEIVILVFNYLIIKIMRTDFFQMPSFNPVDFKFLIVSLRLLSTYTIYNNIYI